MAAAQFGTQSHQYIKNHAHARQTFALETAAFLVRIDDDAVRHGLGRQMVVGHNHIQTQFLRTRHACNAGDTVIHRHQQIHTLLCRDFSQLGR